MKIRTDFVTNSSSSSFVCEYCNNVEAGYDMSLEDANMVRCENGHEMCEYHVDESMDFNANKEMLIKQIKESLEYYSKRQNDDDSYVMRRMVEETSNLDFVTNLTEEQYEEWENEEKFDDLLEYNDLKSTVPAALCPLCNHKHVKQEEIVEYCVEKMGITKKELEDLTREYLIQKDKDKKEKEND